MLARGIHARPKQFASTPLTILGRASLLRARRTSFRSAFAARFPRGRPTREGGSANTREALRSLQGQAAPHPNPPLSNRLRRLRQRLRQMCPSFSPLRCQYEQPTPMASVSLASKNTMPSSSKALASASNVRGCGLRMPRSKSVIVFASTFARWPELRLRPAEETTRSAALTGCK